MMTNKKRVLTAILALCMAASLVACSAPDDNKPNEQGDKSQPTSDTASTTENGAAEETVLTIWNADIASPGIQKTAVADELAKKTGVRMDLIKGDDQKFKVLMAGGDLPDILYTNYTGQGVDHNTLVKSRQLMELDALIQSNGQNILAEFPSKLEFAKKFMSPDSKTYFIPVACYKGEEGNKIPDFYGLGIGFFARWDVYSKIGNPEIKTNDDFLNVLKQMQDANPKTEDGKTVYALSGWTDWGVWPYTVPIPFSSGYGDAGYNMFIDKTDGSATDMFHAEVFWESLKFFNKAYNMGIYDPEAFTQKYEDYGTKCKSGQVLTTYPSWMASEANNSFVVEGQPEKGFQPIKTGFEHISSVYAADAPLGFGADYAMAITNNCKNPEKAMDFLNFTISSEGSRLLYSGIEGVHWEKVDGVPQMKKEYYDNVAADKEYVSKEGVGSYNRYAGVSPKQLLEGQPVNLQEAMSAIAQKMRPIDKEFVKFYGDVEYPGLAVEKWVKDGEYKTTTEFFLAPTLVKEPSDDTKKAMSQALEYMKVAVPQIIMTKNDKDFEAQKAKALSDLTKKGYDTAAKEMADLYAQGGKEAESFKID